MSESASNELRKHGFVNIRSIWVSPDDARVIKQIASKHAEAVIKIRRDVRLRQLSRKIDMDEIVKLREAMVAIPKIADHYGTHFNTIVRAERRLGYPPRKPGTRSSLDVADVLGKPQGEDG